MLRKKLFAIIVTMLIVMGLSGWAVWQKHQPRPDLTQNVTSRGDPIDSSQPVDSSPPVQEPTFDKNKYSLSDPTSIWVVVNKQRPLQPLTYAPVDLVAVGSQQMRQEAATALQQLFAAARTDGYRLSALSGYRSYARQQTVYNREVAQYGQTVADTESARPGHSEHQTGWAVDIGGGGCGIEDCFGNTAEGKWVATNAYRFGFIVRYQAGKETITGYRAEPWHLRYIGTELSIEMHDTSISTLEEFFNL